MISCVAAACFVAAFVVVDGDTIKNPFGGKSLRLVSVSGPFDTPETHAAECLEEEALGQAATARLEALLTQGGHVALTGGICGYGRPCAILTTAAGRNVGEVLIAEGLALPSKNADWCALLR